MIVQFGPYPPGIGGVSIYIKRFKEFIDLKNISNSVWNTSSSPVTREGIIDIKPGNIFKLLKSFLGMKIVHFNISGINAKKSVGGVSASKNILIYINKTIFRKKKKVITVHGSMSRLFNSLGDSALPILNSYDAVICVKENDKKFLLDRGIKTRVYEIPAFIPPQIKEDEIKAIPRRVWDFIAQKEFIISATASKFNFHNNEDLYGADMCVDLCRRLKQDYPNIGFVFSISNPGDTEYLGKLLRSIKDYGIERNFMFITEEHQFYPILMKSSLFVRPTNTDGDALSIREAVNFGVPVLASDVVERPKGVSLFKNRDAEDFYIQAKRIIENYEECKAVVSDLRYESNAGKILNVYSEISKINYGI